MIIKNGVNMELQNSSTMQIQKKHVPSKANIDDQKLIYNVGKPRHNHSWGTQKECFTPKSLTRHYFE